MNEYAKKFYATIELDKVVLEKYKKECNWDMYKFCHTSLAAKIDLAFEIGIMSETEYGDAIEFLFKIT